MIPFQVSSIYPIKLFFFLLLEPFVPLVHQRIVCGKQIASLWFKGEDVDPVIIYIVVGFDLWLMSLCDILDT